MKKLSLLALSGFIAVSGAIATQGIDAASADGGSTISKVIQIVGPIARLLGSTWS